MVRLGVFSDSHMNPGLRDGRFAVLEIEDGQVRHGLFGCGEKKVP